MAHNGDHSADITRLLGEWRAGDREAANHLFPLVYRELRAMAHRQLARRIPGDSLVTTALVHEAYIKLVDRSRASFNGPGGNPGSYFWPLAGLDRCDTDAPIQIGSTQPSPTRPQLPISRPASVRSWPAGSRARIC